MSRPSGPGRVVPFWSVWTRTLDAMIQRLARARSRCRRCGTLLHVDLDTLRRKLGGSASLIDHSDFCQAVGCTGTIYYLGAPATGAAYHVLISDPALFDGVVDPVGLPFRSRWHGMTAISGLPFPAPAEVISLPGAARGGGLP